MGENREEEEEMLLLSLLTHVRFKALTANEIQSLRKLHGVWRRFVPASSNVQKLSSCALLEDFFAFLISRCFPLASFTFSERKIRQQFLTSRVCAHKAILSIKIHASSKA